MSKLKKNLPTIVSIILTVSILLGIFFWFKNTTGDMVYKNNEYYLKELTESQSNAFKTKMNDMLTMLESQARYFCCTDMSDTSEMEKIIRTTKGIGEFKEIGVANKKGIAINQDGKYTNNISHYDYFVSAIQGENTVSKMTYYNKKFGEVLILAVPVIQEQKIEGIVYGLFEKQSLSSLIESISISEMTASILFTLDGTILARNDKSQIISPQATNFYEIATYWGLKKNQTLNDIKIDVLNGQKLILPYKSGRASRISILAPIGLHNWYYAMIIPLNLITEQSNSISTHIAYVEIGVSIAFVMLFISIIYLLRSTEHLSKTNEKYRFVNSKTQTIIFDYDIEKQRLELSGNIESFLKNPREVFVGPKVDEVLKRIHKDDASFLKKLADTHENSDDSFKCEMRLKCVDDHYYWYRLNTEIIRDDFGKAIRYIGNIVNAEEEVTKEHFLKQKAEIDPLTAILNKGAFTDYVSRTLDKATEDDMYAYYIIDLDNFKAVNDNLGHIVGDRVISEAAKKLCIIFSDKDFVGRIGGDEFAAFLKLTKEGKKLGMKIIENKAKAICDMLSEIYGEQEKSVRITASVGVSVYPTCGSDYDALYKAADALLYKSKEGGKNQFHICKI